VPSQSDTHFITRRTHSHSHNVLVVQNQMLAAGSLKISFITMSRFIASLYEFDIPEFFLFFFISKALRSDIFLALIKMHIW